MKNLILFVGALILSLGSLQAQDVRELRGKVVDQNSGKELVFASVSLKESNISTITNSEGEFVLKIPADMRQGQVSVSYLGYVERSIPLHAFQEGILLIKLHIKTTELSMVELDVPRDVKNLIRTIYQRRSENYLSSPVKMTAFYRETIKKRRRNVSLSEAVVNVYKSPYDKAGRDAVTLYKSRKNTDYEKLDTLALKLQGGPFNALLVDLVKYPEYIFSGKQLDQYEFRFDRFTTLGDRELSVIKFRPLPGLLLTLYEGELYLDMQKKVITNAQFSLKINDPYDAAKIFVKKKPSRVEVTPEFVNYRVDYKNNDDGTWYYSYSNAQLSFKVNWKGKLFNSVYTMYSEMAITDWEEIGEDEFPDRKQRMKTSIILSDEASGFADPEFWGPYNIIEPEKSIESAIRKIQRQLKRDGIGAGTAEAQTIPEVIIGSRSDDR